MRIAHWSVINVSKMEKVATSCYKNKMDKLVEELKQTTKDEYKITCKVVRI